jgi:hypothetical protein
VTPLPDAIVPSNDTARWKICLLFGRNCHPSKPAGLNV